MTAWVNIDSIKTAIETLTNKKLEAAGESDNLSVDKTNTEDALKLLEGFIKAENNELTDAQKQQLQDLLNAQKNGSDINNAEVQDLIASLDDSIAQSAAEEIRSSNNTPTLPNNSLYAINPDSSADFLIETDPAFADYKKWLSSDYMMQRLNLDPSVTHKRLGDGYYEQQLIRDQIMALTGRYYLGDYRSNDAQYKGLMDAGITAAKALNLRPGIALTAEQVARLTTDIVWIEEQSITLADGSTQKALVPKVYTRQAASQIDGTGSLIAANNLVVNVTGSVNNQGQLVGHNTLNVKALNLTNEGGGVIAGDYLQLNTTEDLTNKSRIKAGSAANLDIGGNFNNQSETYSSRSTKGLSFGSRTGISQLATIYVGDTLKGQTDENGNPLITFNANVGGNTTFDAGVLDNQGGSTRINTAGDTHLNAVTTGYQTNAIGDANNYYKQGETRDIGSRITGTDNITILSGGNTTGKAVTINSDNGTVGLKAGHDITLTEGRHTQNLSTANKTTDRGFLSKTTTQNRFDSQSDTAISNEIGGDKVIMDADNNLSLTATNAISDHGTYLKAGNNVDILAAQNTSSTTSESSTKKSGVFSSGGLGFTIGKQKQDNDNTQTALTHTASNIGAIDGNVSINAGNHIQQTGSHLIAGMGEDSGKDITDKDRGNTVIKARDIDIDNVMDVYTNQSEQKFKQSGLTVSVSNSLVDSAQNIDKLIDAAGNTSSPRMKGLAAISAGLKAEALAKQGSQALNALQAGNLKDVGNTRIQATIGSSKSQANSQSYREQSQGSTIQAANNLAIIATGGGKDSNININGSDISVGNNALFKADNDFSINGVAQNEQTRSNNKSSSFGVGVYADTKGSAGITANASKGRGHANSDGVSYANSHINVGNTTTLDIGNDMTVKGGVLNTDKLTGQVAGDFNMESLRDTYTYDSKQKNAGFSVDVDLSGNTKASSLSLNGGKTNLNADHAAVTEQTGIYTQKADLNVGGKGRFKGAAFTAASAEDNQTVFAQGIEVSDIQNHSNYDGKAIAAGLNIGKAKDTNPQANLNGIGYGTDSDSQSSTTKAAVTGRAGESQVTTATKDSLNGPLENTFDVSNVNEELGAQVEITRAFDQERRKIKTELNKKEQELRDEAEQALATGDEQTAIEKSLAADKVQQKALLFDGISSALYGPNANGATGYVAKAVSPQVANQIGQYFKKNDFLNDLDNGSRSQTGSPEHLLAHTLLGAAVSYATGNDMVTGGLGASAGEGTAILLTKYIYKVDDPSELTAEQKDTISNITTLAGVAIGSSIGEVTDAVNAGETAKVAVEDNYYYSNLDKIANASRKDVEKIYNIQKSYFEGKCRTAGGDCNYVIKNMLAFTDNSIVKSKYKDLRQQTLNKLNSRPELVITYLDNEFYKLDRRDKNILDTHIKPIIEASGGGIGLVGSVGGTAYACVQTVGIGCYASAILGVAGANSSWDHITTGLNNYGKPVSQQTTRDTIRVLSTKLGLSSEATGYLRQAIDILGTGGIGYTIGARAAVVGQRALPATSYGNNTVKQTIVFNGIQMHPNVPPPVAGWDYKPNILNRPTVNQQNAHVNGFKGEIEQVNRVASLPNEQVLKWGDKIGANGSDIISVNKVTGEVTLWDSKYRSAPTYIKTSPTFTRTGPLANAKQEAIDVIDASSLPVDIKNKARFNILSDKFKTRTTGAGNARNSVTN